MTEQDSDLEFLAILQPPPDGRSKIEQVFGGGAKAQHERELDARSAIVRARQMVNLSRRGSHVVVDSMVEPERRRAFGSGWDIPGVTR